MLWDACTPKLFGYLMNTLRDKALAEDILQATWLKATEALPRFTYAGYSISAWLFTIARNECRAHWRESKREVPLDLETHDQPTPEGRSSEQALLIDQMLAMLSEEDRELIRLRYIADLPMKDIARVLNINPIAARVRMHRATNRARNTLLKNQHITL